MVFNMNEVEAVISLIEEESVTEIIDETMDASIEPEEQMNMNEEASIIIGASDYDMFKQATPDTGYRDTYVLRMKQLDGTYVQKGVKVQIPFDKVVSSVELKQCVSPGVPYPGAQVGDYYLQITYENVPTSIYCPVKDLKDIYHGSQSISIDNNKNISIIIKDSTHIKVDADGIYLDLSDITSSISNETIARQNADDALQSNITEEATTRGNADTQLQGQITNEITNRQNAVSALAETVATKSTVTVSNNGTVTDKVNYIKIDGVEKKLAGGTEITWRIW